MRLAFFAVALTPAALAQAPAWEPLPTFPDLSRDNRINTVDFLRGEGATASDPVADTLALFHSNGVFLYNPSGAAGAAGPNGEWGAWHRLTNIPADDGVVTAAGSFVVGGPSDRVSRGTGRGRTWAYRFEELAPFPIFESTLPALVGPGGHPALFAGAGDAGETVRSLADGAPGTWDVAGTGFGYPQAFGEVPPSAALPNGRILLGVWNGALYSDDGGLSYTRSSAFGSFIAWSFTFAPQPGHPYGGVAYAGLQNRALGDGRGAEVHRSDDGGTTWSLARRFTAAEMALPVPANTDVSTVIVLATPDGALWAGVSQNVGAGVSPPRGGVMRSTDGGQTWVRADAGFRDATNRGYAVNQLKLSRSGVLYAATAHGVWRTTSAVVAGEASPGAPAEIGVSVRPNPAGGRVEVAVSLAAPGAVRVVIVDALGREVAVVLDGEAAGERVFAVDTGLWPAGVYVVRATAGARVATARLVVAR